LGNVKPLPPATNQKGPRVDNQLKTLIDAPSSCHMSQAVEKLSTSSLSPTGPNFI
jgi:hypothetical protein